MAGLGLDAIRTLVSASAPGARWSVLRREAEALGSRIAAAQVSLDLIECALACEHEDFMECPHFRGTAGLAP
ncbi:hypothetical protein OG257_06630 [Streptomyces sp. NBC_00683]|uniref:hypothetical protein n=1 Tax=Streptomyces sp. NBC_00683 TaxID=2903670 RepID=UPI002E3220EE|nr:hypothetical protein [Streptomyces sp. NBC_00683]